MVKCREYLSAIMVFVGATLTFAELVPYTFTGKVSSIVYRDEKDSIIKNPSSDLTAQFGKFLDSSCTYVFNVDALREGEYVDTEGLSHINAAISESQSSGIEIPGYESTEDSITTTLNARLFYCELEEGALLSDFTVDDDSYMNFGMEYETEIVYKMNPETTPVTVSAITGVNLIVGPFSKYIDIRTKEETTLFSQWDASMSYVGTEYISFGTYSVALISDLTFPSVEPPPVPVPEPYSSVLAIVGGIAVAATALFQRKKRPLR